MADYSIQGGNDLSSITNMVKLLWLGTSSVKLLCALKDKEYLIKINGQRIDFSASAFSGCGTLGGDYVDADARQAIIGALKDGLKNAGLREGRAATLAPQILATNIFPDFKLDGKGINIQVNPDKTASL